MANVNGVLIGSASLLAIDFDAVLRGLPDPLQRTGIHSGSLP